MLQLRILGRWDLDLALAVVLFFCYIISRSASVYSSSCSSSCNPIFSLYFLSLFLIQLFFSFHFIYSFIHFFICLHFIFPLGHPCRDHERNNLRCILGWINIFRLHCISWGPHCYHGTLQGVHIFRVLFCSHFFLSLFCSGFLLFLDSIFLMLSLFLILNVSGFVQFFLTIVLLLSFPHNPFPHLYSWLTSL